MMIEAEKQNEKVFLALVPHRDVRSLLRKNCEEMIKAGLTGVYGFPWVAPIAELSEEFSRDELKFAAHSLRAVTGGEKIRTGESAKVFFPAAEENMILWGRKLELDISDNISADGIQKVKKLFSPVVIGYWVLNTVNEQQLCAENFAAGNASASMRENLSFRAAAAANMYWRPFRAGEEICFKWKIGKLAWLPKSVMHTGNSSY